MLKFYKQFFNLKGMFIFINILIPPQQLLKFFVMVQTSNFAGNVILRIKNMTGLIILLHLLVVCMPYETADKIDRDEFYQIDHCHTVSEYFEQLYNLKAEYRTLRLKNEKADNIEKNILYDVKSNNLVE